MANPLDTPQVGRQDGAPSDLHNRFIKDFLDTEESSPKKTSTEQPKPTGTTDGVVLGRPTTVTTGELSPFQSRAASLDMTTRVRNNIADASNRVTGSNLSRPVMGANNLYGETGKLTPYQSPFSGKVSYLDVVRGQAARPIEPMRLPADIVLNATPIPAAAEVKPVKSADGKSVYESTESGGWQIKDKFGQVTTEHVDFPGKKITNVETQPDGSVKLTIDGGKIVRERPEGGRVHYADDAAFKANHPSEIAGKSKDIVWDGDKVKSFYSHLTKTTWHQIADDVWANDANATSGWNGHIDYDGEKGTFRRTILGTGADKGVRDESRANGIKDTFKPDGSMQMEVPYPDGAKVTFKFKQGFPQGSDTLTQPEEFIFVDPKGAETIWKKIGPSEYQSGGGTKWKADIEVKQDGTYSFKDLDTQETSVRTKAGHQERITPKDNQLFEKESGKFTRVKVGDDEMQIDYGADGKPSEYRVLNKNLRITRGTNGDWNDAAIDGGKPFESLKKFEKDIYTHSELDPYQKFRMADSVAKFRALTRFDAAQKDKVFVEADRLLNGRTDSVMSAAEKANYADQLFWHIVNDRRNEQGVYGTCSVTALRGISYKEQPWVIAKLTADLANDGQLVTRDGSTIKPKLDSMRVRPGSPEENFPPTPPNRSALNKLWDVAAVNVSVQRDTKDPLGGTVPKGSLSYEEVPPTGRSDSGSRTVKTDSTGAEYVLQSTSKSGVTTPYDTPRVGFPSRIADIWNQLTGEKLTDRFLVHDNRWVDDSVVFANLVGSKQKTESDVEAVLKKNDRAKVTQINTGVIEQRYRQQQAVNEGKDPKTIARPAGGEHILLVTGYDAASKTVTIDNSWSLGYDMPNQAEAKAAGKDVAKTVFVTLTDLYDAMKTTTSGDSSTWSWMKR